MHTAPVAPVFPRDGFPCGPSDVQGLKYVTILTDLAAFDLSSDGRSVAKQAVLRGALRIRHRSGREP